MKFRQGTSIAVTNVSCTDKYRTAQRGLVTKYTTFVFDCLVFIRINGDLYKQYFSKTQCVFDKMGVKRFMKFEGCPQNFATLSVLL